MQPGQMSVFGARRSPGAEAEGQVGRDAEEIRARAVRLLAAREHSRFELARKLAAKGYGKQAIEEVLDELRDQGYQSDQRFTEEYVRSRVGRGYGPIRIRQDLQQRGLDDELIDAELTCPAGRWIELANAVLGKRFAREIPVDRDAWNTQARFLARRGFPADLIYRVLGQM